MKRLLAVSAALLAAAFMTFVVIAQQGPPPRGGQGGQGGAPRGPGIDALAIDDHTGFESLFDGATLKNWDGDPQFWHQR